AVGDGEVALAGAKVLAELERVRANPEAAAERAADALAAFSAAGPGAPDAPFVLLPDMPAPETEDTTARPLPAPEPGRSPPPSRSPPAAPGSTPSTPTRSTAGSCPASATTHDPGPAARPPARAGAVDLPGRRPQSGPARAGRPGRGGHHPAVRRLRAPAPEAGPLRGGPGAAAAGPAGAADRADRPGLPGRAGSHLPRPARPAHRLPGAAPG